jgi:hypothetical protein
MEESGAGSIQIITDQGVPKLTVRKALYEIFTQTAYNITENY